MDRLISQFPHATAVANNHPMISDRAGQFSSPDVLGAVGAWRLELVPRLLQSILDFVSLIFKLSHVNLQSKLLRQDPQDYDGGPRVDHEPRSLAGEKDGFHVLDLRKSRNQPVHPGDSPAVDYPYVEGLQLLH